METKEEKMNGKIIMTASHDLIAALERAGEPDHLEGRERLTRLRSGEDGLGLGLGELSRVLDLDAASGIGASVLGSDGDGEQAQAEEDRRGNTDLSWGHGFVRVRVSC